MAKDLKTRHDSFIVIPKLTFNVIGIDPLGRENTIFKRPVICFSYYILTFIFAMASIDFGLRNLDDMDESTLALSVLNQLLIALWKIALLIYKRKEVLKLIQTIWQWNEKAKSDELEILENLCRQNSILSKLYFIAVGSAGAIGLLRPFIIKLVKYLNGIDGELEIPHKATFFWNTANPLGYAVTFTWNLVVIIFLWNASVAMDTLFLWFVVNIFIRFRILKRRLETTALLHQGRSSLSSIIEIIKFHDHTLNLAQRLDEIFGEIIFFQSIISCTQICFLTVRFTGKENSIISLFYLLTFLAAVALQLILYCYSGQLIKDQSLMVSTNIFATFKWSKLPRKSQKMLLFIMLRSQKSSHLTGIFFNLDLNLYLWFFKTAASLIAVLKTLEEDV